MKRLVLAAAVLGVMATLVLPSPAPAQTLPGLIDRTCAQVRPSERALDAGQRFVDNESEQLVEDRTLAALLDRLLNPEVRPVVEQLVEDRTLAALLDRALQPEVRLVVDQANRSVVAARMAIVRRVCSDA